MRRMCDIDKYGRCQWRSVVEWYEMLSDFQKKRLEKMNFSGLLAYGFLEIQWRPLYALAQKWDPRTNTFVFDGFEMTITLEDVARLFDLKVYGKPVLGTSNYNLRGKSSKLLGMTESEFESVVGFKGKSTSIIVAALQHKWQHAKHDVPSQEADQALRSFIIYLFGLSLFSDNSGSRISWRYVQFLEDLDQVHDYAWGAAVLAHLYSQLERLKSGVASVGGFWLLIQFWMWEHIPSIRPIVDRPFPEVQPLHARWRGISFKDYNDPDASKSIILNLRIDEVRFRPYNVRKEQDCNIVKALELSSRDVWLFCMNEVELQHGSRVLMQCGLGQSIPQPPHLYMRVRNKTAFGAKVDWQSLFRNELHNWSCHGEMTIVYDGEGFAPGYREQYWDVIHPREPESSLIEWPSHRSPIAAARDSSPLSPSAHRETCPHPSSSTNEHHVPSSSSLPSPTPIPAEEQSRWEICSKQDQEHTDKEIRSKRGHEHAETAGQCPILNGEDRLLVAINTLVSHIAVLTRKIDRLNQNLSKSKRHKHDD
ncbi:Serine/threonine-phosphatase 7 long form-like protein [Nymphaea thermarum]|nr:Serine/threonine-phosphatase 7 long form-like protein [Nymphaea thermarum]